MHNHNNERNKDGGHKGMMWGMILCCALLLGVLFLGGSSFFSGGYLWPIFIGIGVFVVAHIWMIFRGHGHTNTEDKTDDAPAKESGVKDEHKHGGCCH